MHLRLKLKNWRSIAEADVHLSALTVVVGRNSSGKSNLVEALLFSHEVGRDAETAVSRRGGIEGIRRWSQMKPYDVTIEVQYSPTKAELDVNRRVHELVLGSGAAGAWHFKRERILIVKNGVQELECLRDRSGLSIEGERVRAIPDTTSAMLFVRQGFVGRKALRVRMPIVRALRPDPVEMRKPQPPHESYRLNENASNITTALQRLPEAKRGQAIQAMRRIVPGLIDISSTPAGRYLTLTFVQAQGSDRRSEFVATEMSDGALRALALIVAAAQMQREELLIIEEPEVSLHPGAASLIYDVLQSASTKGAVLVTTHSPELLDKAANDNILVCDYREGLTRIGPLAESQRSLVRKGLFTTADLMRSEDLRLEGSAPAVVAEPDK